MGLFDKFKKQEYHFCTECGQKMKKEIIICPKCNFNLKTKEYERSAELKARIEKLKNNELFREEMIDAILEKNKTNPNLEDIIADIEKKAEMVSNALDNINIKITNNGETIKEINIKPDDLKKVMKKTEPVELPFEIKEEVLSMNIRSGRKLSEEIDSLLTHPNISKEGKIDMIYSDIFNIALDYENKGDFDNAIIAYEEAIRIGADAPIDFINLANIYRKLRQWDDEIRICEIAVEQIGSIHPGKFDSSIFERRKKLIMDFKTHENDEDDIISQFFDFETGDELKLDIHRRLKALDFNDVEKTNELVSIVDYLSRNNIGNDKCLAYYNRVFGEVALFNDDKQNAYEYFEKALELDPKVGVKRQYNKLKKELKVN